MGTIIEPSVGLVLVAGAAPVALRGVVRAPGTANLSLVGHAPGVALSTVRTPPTGSMSLAGSTPTVNNPNWVNVNDAQTPNWLPVAA